MTYTNSMKQRLVEGVRAVLPAQSVHRLESFYRITRAQVLSARYGYPAKGLRVIAVTGTNGKTTTVNYINHILKQAGYKTAMFSTALIEVAGETILNDLNVTVGSTARMQQFFRDAKKAKVDFVVLEITSHALDQHKLDGVPIEAAIMTNLTQDHLDYHRTMKRYATAKANLFQNKPRYIVLNRDDEWYDFFNSYEASEQKMTYGQREESETRITNMKLFKKGSEAELVFDHQTHVKLATFLPGAYNVYNMAAAATIAYLLGISTEDIVEGVANLESVPGRYERVVEQDPYDVIVDYAHTADALEKLLGSVKETTKNRTILVFGACGDRDKSKRPIMGAIAGRLADRIIITDEESYNEDPEQIRKDIMNGVIETGAEAKTNIIPNRRDAIEKALSIARAGDTVLVTGMGHEQFRIVKGERLPWNDVDVVKSLHNELRN